MHHLMFLEIYWCNNYIDAQKLQKINSRSSGQRDGWVTGIFMALLAQISNLILKIQKKPQKIGNG
jgi:hypothetical protein